MTHNSNKFKELAKHLRCPTGEEGIQTAIMMQENNSGMISETINQLHLMDNEKILELGFGNGTHIGSIFKEASGIAYYGLDISQTMVDVAKNNNESLLDTSAYFYLSDGNSINWPDNYFNKIFTVNTLYFWESPLQYAKEIFRVLKPGGLFCNTFAPRSFMEKLPFTPFGFSLYEQEEVLDLLSGAGFFENNIMEKQEKIKSNSGDEVDRVYFIIKAFKL